MAHQALFEQLADSAATGNRHDIAASLAPYLEQGSNAMGATIIRNGEVQSADVGTIRADGLGRDAQTRQEQVAAINGDGNKRALSSQDEFPIASITKTFVAAALVQLQAEGKVSLDDRLHDKAAQWTAELRTLYPDAPEAKLQSFQTLLTEFTQPDATLKDLLSHTSGLPGMGPMVNGKSERGGRVHVDFSQEPPAQEGALGFLKPQTGFPLNARGHHDYSNAGYVLSQLIIEAAAKEPFRDVVETRIIEPMKLENTRVTFAREDTPNGAGCMVSTREDLLKFVSTIAQDPAYASMLPEKGKAGIGVQSYEIAGKSWIGHTGGGGIAEIVALVDAEKPSNGFATVKVTPFIKQPAPEVDSASIQASSPSRASSLEKK